MLRLRNMKHRSAVYYLFLAGLVTGLSGCSTGDVSTIPSPSSPLANLVEAVSGQPVAVPQQRGASSVRSQGFSNPDYPYDPFYGNPNVERAVECGDKCPT
jgi:hypothetical protein